LSTTDGDHAELFRNADPPRHTFPTIAKRMQVLAGRQEFALAHKIAAAYYDYHAF
jgi:hypothetical protein